MAGNRNLTDSARNKQDEFYTQISMIENELKHYRNHFRDKVILCNCDDPAWSNFWRYFAINFEFLGLKKLIATHYDAEKPTYKLELTRDSTGNGKVNEDDVVKTPLCQNGDFRSPECIALLREADIVVTNPPFSLFREYISQLIEYKKSFLIIGNINNITYKEITPLIMQNEIFLGRNSGHFWFRVPDWYEEKNTDFKIDENGVKWRRMGNICWYTNMDYPERHEDMTLYRKYTETDYPKYTNCDAIEVSRTEKIPEDYYGVMGVPITFMVKHNPEQFEILGMDKDFTSDGGRFKLLINGKEKTQYARLVIRRKR